MPATYPHDINLLGTDASRQSAEERIINWALTYGRYIMIGTEIVVLLAFISRFSLDRKRTDLREEIEQKQAILTANTGFEKQVRNTQDHLAKIKSFLTDQGTPAMAIYSLASLLPPDVYLTKIEIAKGSISGEAAAGTTGGFSQFLANIAASKQITETEVGSITRSSLGVIKFTFTAKIAQAKTK